MAGSRDRPPECPGGSCRRARTARSGRGPWRRRRGGGSPRNGPLDGAPRSSSERWHRSPSLFLGPALDHGTEPEAQDVELGGDGLHRRQLLVGVAAALDQLLADLGGRQATIQAGGLEGGVGLKMVLDQAAQVIEEMGQSEFNRLAPAQAEGVGASQTRAEFVTGLAEGVAAPAEETSGFALPELELVEGI